MLREVTEIESIGDSCYNLARTINRKHRSDMDLSLIHIWMRLASLARSSSRFSSEGRKR